MGENILPSRVPCKVVMGLPVADLTLHEAVEYLIQEITLPGVNLSQVVTLNPEMTLRAMHDPGFCRVVEQAELVVPDGVGLLWASRKLCGGLQGKVPGVDLVQELFTRFLLEAGRELRVFFLGAKPGVAQEAARRVEVKYHGVKVVGTRHGYFSLEDEEAIVHEINEAKADLLLVGLGSPRQEDWIFRHKKDLQVRVAIGVGGTLDVFSGRVSRAPEAIQHAGLEWLYRLAKEPSRLPRMMALPRFVLSVYSRKFRGRGGNDE